MKKNKNIRQLINNNPWFARYYDFKELNIIWLRDNKEREKIYNKYDFKGKNILDVWCNLWKNFLFIHQKEPLNLVWVDLPSTILISEKLKDFFKLNTVKYYGIDLNNTEWYTQLSRKSFINKFDFSLFVSVYGTKELTNRDWTLKNIIQNTKNVIFFEWHHLDNHKKYAKILLAHNVKNYIFEWYLRDKENDITSEIRPFYTIHKNNLDFTKIIKKIQEIKKKKWRIIIWIQWLAWTWKTSLIEKITSIFNEGENTIIIDDLKDYQWHSYYPTNTLYKTIKFNIHKKINNKFKSLNQVIYDKTLDNIVISDYRLVKYVDNVNILINLELDEEIRTKRLSKRDNQIIIYPNKKIKNSNFSTDHLFTINTAHDF